jgi:cytochrome c-type biogenesis protein CcmH
MTDFRISTVVQGVGALALLAAIALTGCNRNTEPASSAPLVTTGQSAEYPIAAPESAAIPTAAGLKVAVSLSPAVAGKAAPNDVVFIFARPAQGPRMPLAIVQKQVKDLPATIVLDDNNSMSQEMKLSSASEVVVVARVSKSGTAGAQAGDLEGMSPPLKRGTQAVTISIANVVTGK